MKESEYGPKTEEQAKTELRQVLSAGAENLSDDELEARHNRMIEFVKKFQIENPDFMEYELYHLLIGSTSTGNLKKWDTEGHQIENFIRNNFFGKQMTKFFWDKIGNESFWIAVLKWSLAAIYLWFGILKALGYNPVYEIVEGTFPFLVTPAGNLGLGIFEALIGLFLLLNILPRTTHMLLVLHLLGTFLTFVTNPALMFDPHFPILSLAGEFVFKNVTLAAAGLVILTHRKH